MRVRVPPRRPLGVAYAGQVAEKLTREQFLELVRGDELHDRDGRVWTVTAAPWLDGRYHRIVIRCGDNVRRVEEFFAGDYSRAS